MVGRIQYPTYHYSLKPGSRETYKNWGPYGGYCGVSAGAFGERDLVGQGQQ